MKTSDIVALIKDIAYNATSVDMRLGIDLMFQEISYVVALPKDAPYPALVAVRKGQEGITLGYNPAMMGPMSDAERRTILAHEMLHLYAGDLKTITQYTAERDWYKGWKGNMLFNVARDCQINDTLSTFGYTMFPGGVAGLTHLGRDTRSDNVESVMREIADKYPPPPSDDGAGDGDLSADAEEVLAKAKSAGGEAVERQWGSAKSDKPAQVVVSDEQARWERFMAETLDSSKVKETWRDVPKRFYGVKEFVEREAMLPRRTPLPRKSALIAIDVSGSMDEAGVNRLCNLVRNSGATYDLHVILFNTETKAWEDFRTNTVMPMRGGGTDFQPVEDYCAALPRYPDAVLVLTDGQAGLIRPKRPQVWSWVLYRADVAGFRNAFQMRSVDLDSIIKRGR